MFLQPVPIAQQTSPHPLFVVGPFADVIQLLLAEDLCILQDGQESFAVRDVGHVHNLREDVQHLKISQHILATGRPDHQQLATLRAQHAKG